MESRWPKLTPTATGRNGSSSFSSTFRLGLTTRPINDNTLNLTGFVCLTDNQVGNVWDQWHGTSYLTGTERLNLEIEIKPTQNGVYYLAISSMEQMKLAWSGKPSSTTGAILLVLTLMLQPIKYVRFYERVTLEWLKQIQKLNPVFVFIWDWLKCLVRSWEII